MSSPAFGEANGEIGGLGRSSDENEDGLDVGWLLHSKRDQTRRGVDAAVPQIETSKQPATGSNPELTPPPTPVSVPEASSTAKAASESGTGGPSTPMDRQVANGQPEAPKSPANATSTAAPAVTVLDRSGQASSTPSPGPKHHLKRPNLLGRTSQHDETKISAQGSPQSDGSPKQTTRRQSWITTLSSRFSSSSAASLTRSASFDAGNVPQNGPPSPSVGFSNPFPDAKADAEDNTLAEKEQKGDEKPAMGLPRRPSVLVQAGKERDDHTSFLQSAFRKLSSGSSNFGRGAGSCPAARRKIMNLDQNRERVKIAELEASKLRRVAFCVDVEVAGYASWHEVEEFEAERRAAKVVEPPVARRQSFSMLERQMQNVKGKKDKKEAKRDVKEVKSKDEAEGAALKNPQAAEARKEEKEVCPSGDAKPPDTAAEPQISVTAPESPGGSQQPSEPAQSEPQPIPGTRKKEKKKKSEAERKERKERRRRRAEADGEVPLELTGCNDEDGESSISLSPPSSSTTTPSPPTSSSPRWTLSPTTDPLRIYKRCAQLRETTAVDKVCRQISSPSSTLAESPGTVAVLDLSGTVMSLPDLVTLGDWLAVVPVRKILLEHSHLMDEGVRVILSGLLGCKTAEQARHNKRLPKRGGGAKGEEQLGVIEKISLKGNSNITSVGWKHIALFLHTSKSLRAIDLSGIPFPPEVGSAEQVRTKKTVAASHINKNHNSSMINESRGSAGWLLSKALAERFGGNTLEELIMSDCNLSTANVVAVVDAASKCKLRRLGLAGNNIKEEGMDCIIPYVESGVCEGLDLSDNDLHNRTKPLSDSLTSENNFIALSLSGCNLSPFDLQVLLPSFVRLKSFRFIDLSSNQRLFSSQPNVLSLLRKHLPQMTWLKRIHLNDVGLSSEHVIALAEILPECPSLAHLSILDNQPITSLISSKDGAAQEEACALFASLMTAVRVSRSIVAIDIEVPSSDSNEIVKALASQVVAYTLRNLEHGALEELEGAHNTNCVPGKDAPEILLHLVGNIEGQEESDDPDEHVPDDDYLMGGNAICKALGVCLGTAEDKSRSASRNVTPESSGTSTPKLGAAGLKPESYKKPRDMSKELLESARKIKMRLQPALVREDKAGNDFNYRRLQFLDSTLERMIQRFEDEYPECKALVPGPQDKAFAPESCPSSHPEASILSESSSEAMENADGENEPLALRLSRSPSSTSLASKALADEEGRMHRYSQSVRRGIVLAHSKNDSEHDPGTDPHPPTPINATSSSSSPSPANTNTNSDTSASQAEESCRLKALEHRLNNMSGDEVAGFGERCHRDGAEKALIAVLGVTAQELSDIARSDPEAFEKFRESQVAAMVNAGA